MICEYCSKEHDGSYASGRFCSKHCAKGFSTKAKRKGISEKVSKKLKGRKTGRKAGRKFTDEERRRGTETHRRKRQELYETNQYEKMSSRQIRKKIKEEQNWKCNKCNSSRWLGQLIYLELHHKDGNKKNRKRENLEALCLNCHQQTKNYRFNGRKHNRN